MWCVVCACVRGSVSEYERSVRSWALVVGTWLVVKVVFVSVLAILS